MQADAYLGSCADDATPVGICTSHDCTNHAAPGYLMCWECRDALGLTTEGPRPKKEAPVPRQTNPWTPDDIKTLADNAHLGSKAVAELLGRSESAIIQRAHVDKVSLKKRPKEAAFDDRCEGCGNHATQYDIEGVPLCDECMRVTIEDNAKADIEAAHERAVMEAEDEHDRIVERVEAYSPGLPVDAYAGLRKCAEDAKAFSEKMRKPSLAAELAETKIRLAIAMLLGGDLFDTAEVIDALERAAELVAR